MLIFKIKMKRINLLTIGIVVVVALSVSSYFYLQSQSLHHETTNSALELMQTSAKQINTASDGMHKIATTLQRLLAH